MWAAGLGILVSGLLLWYLLYHDWQLLIPTGTPRILLSSFFWAHCLGLFYLPLRFHSQSFSVQVANLHRWNNGFLCLLSSGWTWPVVSLEGDEREEGERYFSTHSIVSLPSELSWSGCIGFKVTTSIQEDFATQLSFLGFSNHPVSPPHWPRNIFIK